MSSKFDSFLRSPLGAFVQSPLGARLTDQKKPGNLLVGGGFTSPYSNLALCNVKAKTWSQLGSAAPDGSVWSLWPDSSNIYLGGEFTSIGALSAARIAKWDGANFNALGSGLPDTVRAVAVHSGNPVAGGVFNLTGGSGIARGIARFDGSTWSEDLPSTVDVGPSGGLSAVCYGLAVIGSELYCLGYFHTTDIATVYSYQALIKKTDSGWAFYCPTLQCGYTGDQGGYATVLFNNALHAVGLLYDYAPSPCGGGTVSGAHNLAAWNGSSWDKVGYTSSPSDVIFCATVYNGKLVIGGKFLSFGTGQSYLAQFDGTNWSSIGGVNPNGYVRALAANGSDLYIGGEFSAIGSTSAARVAHFDGSSWDDLGSTIDGSVYTLALAA